MPCASVLNCGNEELKAAEITSCSTPAFEYTPRIEPALLFGSGAETSVVKLAPGGSEAAANGSAM